MTRNWMVWGWLQIIDWSLSYVLVAHNDKGDTIGFYSERWRHSVINANGEVFFPWKFWSIRPESIAYPATELEILSVKVLRITFNDSESQIRFQQHFQTERLIMHCTSATWIWKSFSKRLRIAFNIDCFWISVELKIQIHRRLSCSLWDSFRKNTQHIWNPISQNFRRNFCLETWSIGIQWRNERNTAPISSFLSHHITSPI
jgi:hypothetical protein